MATFTWSGDPNDPILTCPYEKAHQIIESRMMKHLVKCQENFKDTDIGTCFYNSTHRHRKPEMMYHLKNCPDKEKVLRTIVKTENEVPIVNDDYIVPEIPESSESWDDCNVPTYNPELKVANEPILRSLNVAPKTKRELFRKQEREKFASSSGDIRSSSAGSSRGVFVNDDDDDDDNYVYNQYTAPRTAPSAAYAHLSIATSASSSRGNVGAPVASSSMGLSKIVKEEEFKVVKGKTRKPRPPELPSDTEISEYLAGPTGRGRGRLNTGRVTTKPSSFDMSHLNSALHS